ncbi:ribosome biogenesis protein BRX1 [Vigna unguiculata]|uniref:Ribosome biogenesis protein BRX1 n=1 Tax=Vigna unguiculata TaxID=3917 RepID=A0A4D6LBQ6_VIGUN|nr:ribosome biogenesis protein BRX1 [Vigna unguiculata]
MSVRDPNMTTFNEVVNSSGAGFKNTNLLSTFSSTASILEGFKIRTDHSSFTRNVIELANAPFLDIRKPSMNLTGKVEQLYDVKRKRIESSEVVAQPKKEDAAPERPARTLLGWKDKSQVTDEVDDNKVVSPIFRNKEKVLVTCSRRISYRYRHLMLNLVSLMPHCKKDNKVESKETKGATLNELVELKSCSSCLFFECRKQKDLYLWMAKCPSGPSVKFLVSAVHTMEELKLTGNHLKGSRPLLTFSANFEKDAHWRLLKQMLLQSHFPQPYNINFFMTQYCIMCCLLLMPTEKSYILIPLQISAHHNESDKLPRGGLDKMTLIEVGPRFCLNPIKIFGGSFGGPTLYENPFYVSPNQIRALEKKKKSGKFAKKVKAKTRRKMHEMSNPLEPDEFADMWKD